MVVHRSIPPTLFAALLVASSAFAGTLRDALRESSVPATSAPIRNLDRPITSFGILDNESVFAIAYYLDDGSGRLRPPLYVARYAKHDHRWIEGEVVGKAAASPQSSVDCFGSAEEIHQVGNFFLIDTHLSPSAGCLIVLSAHLRVTKMLYGWYLAGFGSGTVIFHRSMVHFAPTHPMQIALFDLDRGSEVEIYPPKRDPLRLAYVQRLRPVIGDETWCNQHNSHCNPEQFENELARAGGPGEELVAVNDATDALAFAVEFDPYGIVPEEVAKLSPDLRERVVYVFRLRPSGVDHREFRLAEMKGRFEAASIGDLVRSPILEKVFGSAAQERTQ